MKYRTEIRNSNRSWTGEGHTPLISFMSARKEAKLEKRRYTVIILAIDDCEIFRAQGMSPKSAYQSFRDNLRKI